VVELQHDGAQERAPVRRKRGRDSCRFYFCDRTSGRAWFFLFTLGQPEFSFRHITLIPIASLCPRSCWWSDWVQMCTILIGRNRPFSRRAHFVRFRSCFVVCLEGGRSMGFPALPLVVGNNRGLHQRETFSPASRIPSFYRHTRYRRAF